MITTGLLLSGSILAAPQTKLAPLEQRLVGTYNAIAKPGMTPDSKRAVLVIKADRSFVFSMPGNRWFNRTGKWSFKAGSAGWKVDGVVLGTLAIDRASYAFDGERLLNPDRRVTNFQKAPPAGQ
jgi:hypothetical protein